MISIYPLLKSLVSLMNFKRDSWIIHLPNKSLDSSSIILATVRMQMAVNPSSNQASQVISGNNWLQDGKRFEIQYIFPINRIFVYLVLSLNRNKVETATMMVVFKDIKWIWQSHHANNWQLKFY